MFFRRRILLQKQFTKFARNFYIFSIFLFYAEKLQLLKPSAIETSVTYGFVQPWGPKVIDGLGTIIPIFKDMFSRLEEFFSGLSNKIAH